MQDLDDLARVHPGAPFEHLVHFRLDEFSVLIADHTVPEGHDRHEGHADFEHQLFLIGPLLVGVCALRRMEALHGDDRVLLEHGVGEPEGLVGHDHDVPGVDPDPLSLEFPDGIDQQRDYALHVGLVEDHSLPGSRCELHLQVHFGVLEHRHDLAPGGTEPALQFRLEMQQV